MMQILIVTLWAKIVLTVFLWTMPLLLVPRLLDRLGIPAMREPLFGRLLGIMFLALVVMYIFGLLQAYRGEVPWPAIIAGMVSNGGAAALILIAATSLGWFGTTWTPLGRIGVLVSGALAGCVFLGLAIAAIGLRSAGHP
jgi:hypothetical protein